MTRVVFRVDDAGAYAETVRSKLPFSRVENGSVLVPSQLGEGASLNEHLVWLWGMLKNERRVLKTAAASGARLVCHCVVSKGGLRLQSNGAEMLHLLGAELVAEVK